MEDKMKEQIAGLIKQTEQMQQDLKKIQQKLADTAITGEAGAGLVKADVTCKYETRRVSIDLLALFTDEGVIKALLALSKDPDEMLKTLKQMLKKCGEMLEDLVKSTFNDAAHKIETRVQKEMSSMTSGLQMPAEFKLPF